MIKIRFFLFFFLYYNCVLFEGALHNKSFLFTIWFRDLLIWKLNFTKCELIHLNNQKNCNLNNLTGTIFCIFFFFITYNIIVIFSLILFFSYVCIYFIYELFISLGHHRILCTFLFLFILDISDKSPGQRQL